jgi:PhnB protein
MLNPVLFFKGNAEEALEFYRNALGGEVHIVRYKETPSAQDVPTEWASKIVYGTLCGAHGQIALMDAPPGREGQPGDNFAIALEAESESQIDAIYAKLGDGGTIMMPLGQTFWARKFGMLDDKFGTRWMLSYGTSAREGYHAKDNSVTVV